MTIYLCVKTHNITGLKYLCKTKKNPFRYNGSGTDWKLHLSKYGKSHHTDIIKTCQTNEELTYWGRYYSNLWNIVNGQDDFGNKIWANKIPETGGSDGTHNKGKHLTQIHKSKIAESVKLVWDDVEYKTAMSKKFKDAQANPELKMHLVSVRKQLAKNPESKKIRSNNTKISWENPNIRNNRIESLKKVGLTSEFKEKMSSVTSGENNPSFDHTLYHWEHISGITEYLTRYSLQQKYNLNKVMLCRLVSGNAKMHRGWRLIKVIS